MEGNPVVCAVEVCQLRAIAYFEIDGLLFRRGSSLIFLVILIRAGIGETGEIVQPGVLVVPVLIHGHFIFLDD